MIEQQTIVWTIQRIIENFRELGKAKHTEAVTLNRIHILKEILKRCQLEALASDEDRKKEHYFTEEIYSIEKAAYFESFDNLQELLA